MAADDYQCNHSSIHPHKHKHPQPRIHHDIWLISSVVWDRKNLPLCAALSLLLKCNLRCFYYYMAQSALLIVFIRSESVAKAHTKVRARLETYHTHTYTRHSYEAIGVDTLTASEFHIYHDLRYTHSICFMERMLFPTIFSMPHPFRIPHSLLLSCQSTRPSHTRTMQRVSIHGIN